MVSAIDFMTIATDLIRTGAPPEFHAQLYLQAKLPLSPALHSDFWLKREKPLPEICLSHITPRVLIWMGQRNSRNPVRPSNLFQSDWKGYKTKQHF